MATEKAPSQSAGKIGIFTLAIMNVVAVVSLRGLPAEAEYGLSSIFYYLFAAVVFLIPVSLVAAELATGWPEKGGVFRWVGEAFGPRWAFVAMFMLWIEVTVWFPTGLTFGAVSLAFIGPNQRWDQALSANNMFVLGIVLAIYWLATFIAFRGVEAFARVSKWGGIIGTIIPAGILIVLGFAYLFGGGKPQIDLAWKDVIPDFTNFNNVVLAAGIFLFYAGMEMNAIHVKDVSNPVAQLSDRDPDRRARHGVDLRARHAGDRLHDSAGPDQPHPKPARRLLRHVQVGAHRLARPRHGGRAGDRRARWRRQLGGGTIDRPALRRQGRLSAALLAEDQREGHGDAHPADPGHSGHRPVDHVRGAAVGAGGLPDPEPAHRHPLSGDVPAHVRRGHLPPLQPAEPAAAVQHPRRRRWHVDHRRLGFLGSLLAFVLSFIPPGQISVGSPMLVRRHPDRS